MSSAAPKEAPSEVIPAKLYTYEQIGEWADASPRQVRRWVESGWIDYVQRPQGRRISGQQYMDWVAGRSVPAEA